MTTSSNNTLSWPFIGDALRRFGTGLVRFIFPPPSEKSFETKTDHDQQDNGSDNPEQNTPYSEHTGTGISTPQTPSASLSDLMKSLLKEKDLTDTQYYKNGYKAGRDGSNPSSGIAAIEFFFNEKIHSENQLKQDFGKEILQARQRVLYLEEEIARLNHDLDENDPQSNASRLRREIQTLQDEINTHLRVQYQDKFIQGHARVMDERESAELEFIERMKTRREELYEDWSTETDQKKKTEKEKVFKNIQKYISGQYKKLATSIKRDANGVPGFTRIFLTLLTILLVLGGEFFIIYHLTSKVLGMEAIMASGGDKLGPNGQIIPADSGLASILQAAIYIFCLAYPIALGMLVKILISNAEDRAKTTQNLMYFIGSTSLLMVAGIAILNPSFLSDPGMQAQKLLTDNTALYHPIYALVFFGITSIFSGVAGILYVEFIEGCEMYRNVRKRSLFYLPFQFLLWIFDLKDKDMFVENREERIQQHEREIELLRQKRERYRQQQSELQGLAAMDLSTWSLAAMLEAQKQGAVSEFRFGYEAGINELMREKENDPVALIDFLNSRKIIQHYMAVFNNRP